MADQHEQDGTIEDEAQNNEEADSTDELIVLLWILYISESDESANDCEDNIGEM